MTKVLVVEDEQSVRELISTFLKDDGYEVIDADSAKKAEDLATQQKPDVVVTDVVMPEKNGFELCRSLKKNEATQNIPVIVCSSKNQDLDILWGKKQGADVYVTKPFTKDDIIKAVKSVAG
ncbi:MAG: response regulator [Moorea sp. SIO2B7]|nr:response regulator [Moorena sp. SIO2B7]